MTDSRVDATLTLLAQSLRGQHCANAKALMAQLPLDDGAALLACLRCVGNAEAFREQVAEAVAQRILPQDEVATLVAAWLPLPEALRKFDACALDAGADPLDPQLTPEIKMRLLIHLSRSAQVAFETYALAREVAVRVLT